MQSTKQTFLYIATVQYALLCPDPLTPSLIVMASGSPRPESREALSPEISQDKLRLGSHSHASKLSNLDALDEMLSAVEFAGESVPKDSTSSSSVQPSESTKSTTTTTTSSMGGESEVYQRGSEVYGKKFGIQIPKIPQDVLTPEMIQFGISFVGPALGTGTAQQVAYLKLEVRGKKLRDISILAKYPHLRLVDLTDNDVSDLEPLSNMKYLQVLNVEGNKLASVESVSHFHWLQALNLSRNGLSSLEGFPQSNLISYLNLSNNNLSSVEWLNGDTFPHLLLLELRGNFIVSIADIELPKLRHLYIAKNGLISLDGLHSCPELEKVHARDNKIESLVNFPSLEKLKYINLRRNKLNRFTETVHLGNSANLEVVILKENTIANSERYREELCSALLNLKRLDKTLVTEEELVQGRLLRTGRIKNLVKPLENDETLLTPAESDGEFGGEYPHYGQGG